MVPADKPEGLAFFSFVRLQGYSREIVSPPEERLRQDDAIGKGPARRSDGSDPPEDLYH
jgi:hypothetical protein